MRQPLFERAEAGRMRIHVLPTDRFKTYAISVFIGRPLHEDDITSTALVPFVLRRGTERFPATKQFREQLDLLYGAGFGFDVYKRGNNQIVQFRMDTIDDRFVAGKTDLLREALALTGQLLTRPARENGGFVGKYVEAEKQTVRKRLEAVINDKIRYAAERCIAHMFPDDPFRHNALGRLEELEGPDPQGLFAFYRDWLSKAQIDLYVVGNTSLEAVAKAVEEEFALESGTAAQPYRFAPPDARNKEPVRTVTEELDVGQGKLNIGLTAPVLYADPDYPAMMVYNGVFGGYPHSKLFMNVREKASLAYYASSRYDGFKGFVMVQSGIEIANYDKALGIIREQLEEMREGRISDTELEQTKAMITGQLMEINDSAFAMIGFDFNTQITGSKRTISDLIDAVGAVTKEQIAGIAGNVRLDTIYFLRDRKGA